jgi:hypothetical protein
MPSALKRPTLIAPVAAPVDHLDTRGQIIERAGDLSAFEIANNEVLLAIYERPETSLGGIIIPASNLKEDLYQGKVHLVLKIGAACRFQRTDSTGVSYGLDIHLHDWVYLKPSDAWAFDLNPKPESPMRENLIHCRLAFDDQVRGRIPHPAMVW